MSRPTFRSGALRLLLPLVACLVILRPSLPAQTRTGMLAIAPRTVTDLRSWNLRIDRMTRDGELRLRQRRTDTLVAGRTHERYDQYYRGVRVFGADLTRQVAAGQVASSFGFIYDGIGVDPAPELDAEGARRVAARQAGKLLGPAEEPELVVLPLETGGFALTWRVRAFTGDDIRQYFIDARTGAIVFDFSDLQTQSAVGKAQGVLGDTKKIAATAESGRFTSVDHLRPPLISTYDMQGNVTRADNYLDGFVQLAPSDLGSDSDNNWTDGAVTDAHIYAGYTYDYYFRRFGRKGLDNGNMAMINLVHPVKRSDFTIPYYQQHAEYFTNAFYAGRGIMAFGEGLPPNVTLGGQTWDFMAGAIDVVGHELTHGVTEFSSRLIYRNESGALNEAFSDIMGTNIEFFFQPAGNGSMKADYLVGEDVVRPGGIRSMADPLGYGDPDHYSLRYLGSADGGGVHINSTIASHAYYLAIEGGTNRTSGITVQGVGAANREQMEKVFYRAFTQLMPAAATFSTARLVTIQAARDLYGAGSAVERAVTDAWTAVGVF